MPNASPLVDAYIARSPDYARPILTKFRRLVHKGFPEVHETIKWRWPYFEHCGLIVGMAAFKKHVRIFFWKGKTLKQRLRGVAGIAGLDRIDQKIARLEDLPPDRTIVALVIAGAQLNEDARAARSASGRTKPGARRKKTVRRVIVPADLRAALAKDPKAQAVFDAFSYSHKKEYVEWITTAKRKETREKRLKLAIAWMAEGKPHNWKYLR